MNRCPSSIIRVQTVDYAHPPSRSAAPWVNSTVRPTGPGKTAAVILNLSQQDAMVGRKRCHQIAEPPVQAFLSPHAARALARELLGMAEEVERSIQLHNIEVPW